MKLTYKIGEGYYRECFATDDTNLCAKRQKKSIQKNYFGLKVHFNTKIYTLLKFGVQDLNEKELNIINSLPDELSIYLPDNLRIENGYLVMERPKNYSGEYSKTVEQYGRIKDDSFWKHIDNIQNIFVKNNLWFLDIFHYGNNLLVQKESKDEYKPIIIDYKRLGRYMYPFQFNLLLLSEQKKKFNRRFEKFKEQYR